MKKQKQQYIYIRICARVCTPAGTPKEVELPGGYTNEGYAFMEVLWRSTPAKCVAVETDSVDLFIGTVGCHNATRGGGGVDATREDYQQHVYVVFSPISFLIKFRLEHVRGLPLVRYSRRETIS